MLWLHSVSCHHGDHGEPGSWIYSNKLVCTLISHKAVNPSPTTQKTKLIAFLHPPCLYSYFISHVQFYVLSTSIQKPFVHIDSERIVQTKWYNQMVGHGVGHQHANGFMLVRYILIMKYSCISLVSFLSRVREHISKTSK